MSDHIHPMWAADVSARQGIIKYKEAKGAFEALKAMGDVHDEDREARVLRRLVVSHASNVLPVAQAPVAPRIPVKADLGPDSGDFVKVSGIKIEVRAPLNTQQWVTKPEPVAFDWTKVWPYRDLQPVRLNWKQIAKEVCAQHRVSLQNVLSPRRDAPVCAARHEIFWRLKKETALSLPEIGRLMGKKDHTTVLHGIKRHEARLKAAEGAA